MDNTNSQITNVVQPKEEKTNILVIGGPSNRTNTLNQTFFLKRLKK